MTTPIPGTCGNQPPSETRGKRNRPSRAASLLQPQETECSTPKELGSGGGEHRCSQFPSVCGGSSVNPAVCVGSLQEATLMGTESQDAARQTAQAAWWHRSPRRALRLSEPPPSPPGIPKLVFPRAPRPWGLGDWVTVQGSDWHKAGFFDTE